jgi:hypothetical protein
VWAHDLTEDQVESVLLDDQSEATPNRFFPEHCLIYGCMYTDRFIVAAFEILDEIVAMIRPITVFEPNED